MVGWLKRLWSGKSEPDFNGPGWSVLGSTGTRKDANEIWRNRGTTEMESILKTQLVVYACIKKICLTAQEAPIRAGRKVRDGWEDFDTYPLLRLLNAPNPDMNYALFQWHALALLCLTGEVNIWKWRNAAGYVAELWPVPTSWVTPMVDGSGRLSHYEIFQGHGRDKVCVPPRDLTRIMFPDPSNRLRGLGPLQAASRDVQTDEERQDYMIEMLTNTRAPGTIFMQPMGWEEEQKAEIRALFADGLGRGKRGRTLFLEGAEAKLEQVAPLKDLDWPGLTTLSETRICAAFGVPPIIIGLRAGLESATYSNYEQALKSFMQGTMTPLWSMLDAGLTKGLLRDEGTPEPDELYHDTTEIPALQEDKDKRATRAATLLGGSVITRNEAREMVGLERLEDGRGDVFVMPMSMLEVPANQTPEKPPLDDGKPNEAAETE